MPYPEIKCESLICHSELGGHFESFGPSSLIHDCPVSVVWTVHFRLEPFYYVEIKVSSGILSIALSKVHVHATFQGFFHGHVHDHAMFSKNFVSMPRP